MNLSGESIKDTYGGILNIGATGLTGSLQTVTDGFGNPLPMEVSETGVNFTGTVTGIPGGIPAQRIGTNILFDQPSVYGTPNSPQTGDLTVDYDGTNNNGVTSTIIHSSLTTPTFSGEFSEYSFTAPSLGANFLGTYQEADAFIGFTVYGQLSVSPGIIYDIAPAGGTAYYYAGTFNRYKGQIVGPGIVRLFDDGTLDTSFQTGTGFYTLSTEAPGTIYSIDVDTTTGKIYVAGLFTHYNGTQVCTSPGNSTVVRLEPTGQLDQDFRVDGNNFRTGAQGDYTATLYTVLAVQNELGGCWVGGNFTRYAGSTVLAGVVRFNNTGGIYNDGTWDSSGFQGPGGNQVYSILSLARASDNDLIVGGYFSQFQGSGAWGITKMESQNGFRIGSFDAGSGFNTFININKILIDSSDNIYAAGSQTSYKGNASFGITKMSATGALDGTFSAPSNVLNQNGGVRDAAFDDLETIWAVGGFGGSTGGSYISNMIHLNSTGGAAVDWEFPNNLPYPVFSGAAYAVLPLASGEAFVGFSGGTYIDDIVGGAILISATGGYDTSFDTVTGTVGIPNYITATYFDGTVKYTIYQ